MLRMMQMYNYSGVSKIHVFLLAFCISVGVAVMSKCFQVFKSIMYYIFLLLVLVFGFLIYW